MERIRTKVKDLETVRDTIESKEKQVAREYERLAQLSTEDAREIILQKVTSESADDIQSRMLKLARDGEAELMSKARDILVNCVYRIANANVSSFTSSTVEITDEEIKGKIIGKEASIC